MLVKREPDDRGLKKAVSYYRRAADGGLADAQYAMSQIFANGTGGERKDDTAARRWLLLAARQNFDTAQLDLGRWLMAGRGGERNRKEGFGWLLRARARRQRRRPERCRKTLHAGDRHRPGHRRRRVLVHPRPPRRAGRPDDGGFLRRPDRGGDQTGAGAGEPAAIGLVRILFELRLPGQKQTGKEQDAVRVSAGIGLSRRLKASLFELKIAGRFRFAPKAA